MPSSLENLQLSGTPMNPHKFTGGIPTEWSSLTNLKELKIMYCGLDGASCVVCSGAPPKRTEKRIASAGPPLPETLQMLAPLAPTLEKLKLGGNKVGGTITADIVVFTKLTELDLSFMNLQGAVCSSAPPQTRTEKRIVSAQENCRSPSACSRRTDATSTLAATRASRSRATSAR